MHACRRLLGEGLESCTIEELQEIEQQLERSVSSVRARKVDHDLDHIKLRLYIIKFDHLINILNQSLSIYTYTLDSSFQGTNSAAQRKGTHFQDFCKYTSQFSFNSS